MNKFLKDLTERIVVTAVLAFLSSFSLTDLSSAKSAAVAAGTAVAQLVIGVLSQRYGDTEKAGISK
jgi:hypothetical protein